MSNYTENDLRKMALLSKVIRSYEEMLDNLSDDADIGIAKKTLLAKYLKYFELVEL